MQRQTRFLAYATLVAWMVIAVLVIRGAPAKGGLAALISVTFMYTVLVLVMGIADLRFQRRAQREAIRAFDEAFRD